MPLPIPVARQREVVCLPARGHQVVLGTAGSGKTTMAILRAAYLADPELPGNGRTLLLTFNKALSGYIRAIAGPELRNVDVDNYHRFARGYLNARGQMGQNAIAGPAHRMASIQRAIVEVKSRHNPHSFFDRPLGFFESEISWLEKHGVPSAADYKAQDRVGRAEARLERVLRDAMWAIYEAYVGDRTSSGFRYDWDSIASAVAAEFGRDNTARRYKHIVIDEGQDLSPEMLRSLAAAIPAEGSITFFGDVAQQIYGHRMSWRSAGLNPGPIWRFTQNYRNTQQIAALGLAVAQMPYYQGLADMVAPVAPPAAGPKPTLVRFNRSEDELPFVVAQGGRIARTQTVVILARTVRQVDLIKRAARGEAISLREDARNWVVGPNLYVGTYHSAKGLEFDAVILPFLSDESFPDPTSVAEHGQDEADANDGRLLYVGVTRAKRALVLTYSGTPTRLLPADEQLYTKVEQ